MKYVTRTSFFNQVLSSTSSGFSNRVYWVGVSDDYERKEIVESLLHSLGRIGRSLRRFSSSTFLCKELADHLQTESLFKEEPIAWIDEVDKLIKADLAFLQSLFPTSFGYLILSAKGKSPLSETVEKEGIVLDLLGEKWWEKEKRMEQQLDMQVKRNGKVFGPGALRSLLERCDLDAGLLEREVDKLLCYVGDRPRIENIDVAQIASSNHAFTVWEIAEGWIWEGTGTTDETLFHALVPTLRLQLQLGLKISTLIHAGAPREEWGNVLPKLHPKVLEKRTPQAAKKGTSYFQRGLLSLFEIELQSRSGSTCYGALLDLFRCKLGRGS